MTINMNIETKNVIKFFAVASGFTLGVLALFKMYDSLLLVLIAFFIALAISPVVSFLAKYMPGKRRGPAIALALILVIALFGVMIGSIVPPVVRETSKFVSTLPETVNKSFYRNEKVQNFVKKYSLQDDIDRGVGNLKKRATSYGDKIVNEAGAVGSSVITTLTVFVMTVLMLTGGRKLLDQLACKIYRNKELRQRHEAIAAKMYQAVTGYVIGQVSVALVASLFALGAMFLLRIPYPLPLAGIVFVFGLIPLIGNTIAAIIVTLATLVFKDATSALILLVFFVLYQQIENATLQPIVQGKTTNLPPLVIFVSVILGVGLLGPIGGLFAIPAAGCAKVLLIDYLDHRDNLKASDSPKTLVEKVKNKLVHKVEAKV